jgi:hypothetical protein
VAAVEEDDPIRCIEAIGQVQRSPIDEIERQNGKCGTDAKFFRHARSFTDRSTEGWHTTHPEEGIGIYRRESPDRKPGPGMLLKARDEFDLDMSASVLVGDRETDIQAAINGGVGTHILIEGAEPDPQSSRAHRVVDSLAAAVDWIASRDGAQTA